MSRAELDLLLFSLGAAGLATALILPPGLAVALLMARKEFPGKSLVETLITLPLVLPPVATGLVLLELLGRRGPLGGFLHRHFDLDIAFTWRGVVVAMAVMSFPLLVRGARIAFEGVPTRLEQIARTLGAGEWRVLVSITLPLALRGIVGGALLAFARALGEFGATMMVAGNIPGRTSTLSLAIYQAVQLGDDTLALRLAGYSAVLALLAVWTSEALRRR